MPITFLLENTILFPTFLPISIPYRDQSQSPSNKPSRFPHIVLSVDPYGDPRSAPSYVPILNPSRAPSEQQVEALQEERRATLKQVQSLEIIIASGEITIDESDQ